MYRYPDAIIMVFCKSPVPGEVKTRLTPPLKPEEATQLHCELARLTLKTATQNALCPVQLWGTPTIDHPYFMELEQTYSIERKLQEGTNLGEKMHHAFRAALARFKQAILIGCDCPTLTNADLDVAIYHLSQNINCVLSPAEDGGYVLIGLNHPQPSLFENMPWGSPEVFALTKAKIEGLKLKTQFLKTQWDVDTFEDFQRYRVLFEP